jgi:hypothetical protein
MSTHTDRSSTMPSPVRAGLLGERFRVGVSDDGEEGHGILLDGSKDEWGVVIEDAPVSGDG